MSQKIDVLSKFPDAAQLGELYRRAVLNCTWWAVLCVTSCVIPPVILRILI